LLLLLAGVFWWPLAIGALFVLGEHVRRHLWAQAMLGARAAGDPMVLLRILAVMEFVRLVNIAGFCAGKLDRWRDPSFRSRQREWMGSDAVEPDFLDRWAVLARALGQKLSVASGWAAGGCFATALVTAAAAPALAPLVGAAFAVALVCTLGLSAKSFYDFTQTGPPLREEILRHYRWYSMLALMRLTLWALVLCTTMATLGVLVYAGACALIGKPFAIAWAGGAGLAGIALVTALQFCHQLLFLPGSIAASYHYRMSRLYPLWQHLTPRRVAAAQCIAGALAMVVLAGGAYSLLSTGAMLAGAALALAGLSLPLLAVAVVFSGVVAPLARSAGNRPNIIMIGSDTLRADRLGIFGYRRNLTPFIDSVAARGTAFASCYVPCARTAPSLVSMLTGTWPRHHGIRDNFIGDAETRLSVPALGALLASHGYRTAAVSDWSGSDFAKFQLGFELVDVPDDQWNLKYLIRQGPKDLRLFVSLFTHN